MTAIEHQWARRGHYSRRAVLVLLIVLALVSQSIPADAHHIYLKRHPRSFRGVTLQTRGYIPEECVVFPAPCLTQPEATAKTYVLRELVARHPSLPIPGFNLPPLDLADALVEAAFDKVHWEVGVDGLGGWRIDVLVDDGGPFPTILEAKRWSGPATITAVDKQLTNAKPGEDPGYIQRAASVGLTVERNDELNVDKWLEPYIDDTGGLSCVWADEDAVEHAGNIYYSPILAVPAQVQVRCAVRAVVKAIVTRYLLKAATELARALRDPTKAPPVETPCGGPTKGGGGSRAKGCAGGVRSYAYAAPAQTASQPPTSATTGPLDCGSALAANTAYTLDTDIGPCSGNGIEMADGATLDLNGHRVFGPTVAAGLDEAGILFNDVQGATVTDSTATNVDGTWVSTNAVTLFDAGIAMINGSSNNTVEKLNIVGNFGVDGDYGEGIHVRDSDFNTLSANTVVANGPLAGISLLDDSDSNVVASNIVNANTMATPTLIGPGVMSDPQAIGIRLEVSLNVGAGCPDQNSIIANAVRGNPLDAISVMNGPACDSTANLISANALSGNGRDGIRLNARLFGSTCYGAEATVVTANTVTDSGGGGIKATNCVHNSSIDNNVVLLSNPLVPPIAPVTENAPPHGDVHDGNVNCGSNQWAENVHVTEYAAPGSATALIPLDYLCVE